MKQLLNFFKLLFFNKDEALYTCFQNNIPLTNENIKEVRQILKQKKI